MDHPLQRFNLLKKSLVSKIVSQQQHRISFTVKQLILGDISLLFSGALKCNKTGYRNEQKKNLRNVGVENKT